MAAVDTGSVMSYSSPPSGSFSFKRLIITSGTA